MRAESIEDYADAGGIGILDVDAVAHAFCEVDVRPLIRDLDVPPRTINGDEVEEVRGALR